MAPNMEHYVVYRSAGLVSTQSAGAYYLLPLCFGKLVLTSPAVVLENKSFEILIVTQLFVEFDGIVNHHKVFLSLLGYFTPLATNGLPTKWSKKRQSYLLE